MVRRARRQPDYRTSRPHTSRTHAGAPATNQWGGGKGAAARDCTGAASHHTVVRASVGASAARDERAE
eukprot:scaffold27479_cov73-Phaeocystis_antarctica.AAC.1